LFFISTWRTKQKANKSEKEFQPMEVLVIGITAATLLYVLAVAGLAYQLKRMPRPYSTARSKRYLRSIERLRVSL
jgi:hypothetical protein